MENRRKSSRTGGQGGLTAGAAGPSVVTSPEGLSDTNGGDRINAHVSGRFLRAFPCPAPIIRAVTPLLPLLAGLVALAFGAALLASLGPRYRIGRLLAATRAVPVDEAVELARRGETRYVRVDGRIDSESEFEDDAHRPLVLRLTRLEARRGARWHRFDTVREGVPFEIREDLDAIGVDHDRLDEGLVVVPRESVGVVGDLGDRAPSELDAETPARAVIQLVSSVEHAVVLGVPALAPDGRPWLTAGLGRPLILTTLEQDEAMRILGRDAALRIRAAAGCLVGGAALTVLGGAWLALGGAG